MFYHIIFLGLYFSVVAGAHIKSIKKIDIIHSDSIKHVITKRGINPSDHPFNKIKEVHFNGLNQNFRLILSPNKDILDSKFRAVKIDEYGKEQDILFDKEEFYVGRVFGSTNSHVSVHIDDNLITGTINLPEETYHIEPAWRHLDESDNQTMIFYKKSDVNLNWSPDDSLIGTKTCNADELKNDLFELHRDKRQIIFDENEGFYPTKTRCSLLLVADYTFYKNMGGASTKKTINYLISLIDRVHTIYNKTVWKENSDDSGFKGMGFSVKKIVVHDSYTKPYFPFDEHYNMQRNRPWNVRHLLEIFSRNKENKYFCLAHLFTHQTFKTSSSVVLGLAYIASPRRTSHGGICTKEFTRDGHKVYLNSGLSSSSNLYGRRVITREAELVTAHEFGHNWGSEHDPDIPECSPNSRHNGSFLMYSYSVSGLDVNNRKFSPCSIRSIRKVLESKSDICFTVPEKSFCGNSLVEEGEECDAGLFGSEDPDQCCDKNCRLRPGAVCSDKNSPCCLGCRFIPSGIKCRDAQYATCQQESYCNGLSPNCPNSFPMQDGTECLEKGKCLSGRCVHYCETKGLYSCMCDKVETACMRCCRTSFNETCAPPEPDQILPDGTPCMVGFCENGMCKKTAPEFVERFWNIIDHITINTLWQFLKDNIVGSVVLITAIIWIPACYIINKTDKKRKAEKLALLEWECSRNYAYPPINNIVHVYSPAKDERFERKRKGNKHRSNYDRSNIK